MATSNIGRFYEERYRVALEDYDTDRHDEALAELADLLMDENLPSIICLKANAALADGVDDFFLAEEYRSAAELIYNYISNLVSGRSGWQDSEEARELQLLRDMLDALADNQRLDDPRQTSRSPDADTTNDTHMDVLPGAAPQAIRHDPAPSHQSEESASDESSRLVAAPQDVVFDTHHTVETGQPDGRDSLDTFGIPLRPGRLPDRTTSDQQVSTPSRHAEPSAAVSPNMIAGHFSASKSTPRRRSLDPEDYTGSPSKKRRGGAQ